MRTGMWRCCERFEEAEEPASVVYEIGRGVLFLYE